MNENAKSVNYELAYRLIMLVIETTDDRHSGSCIHLDRARRILGASDEDFDLVVETLQQDMVLNMTSNGTLFVG